MFRNRNSERSLLVAPVNRADGAADRFGGNEGDDTAAHRSVAARGHKLRLRRRTMDTVVESIVDIGDDVR